MPASLLERISRSRLLLGNPYAYLNGEGNFEAAPLHTVPAGTPFALDLETISSPALLGKSISFEQIEDIAKKLQNSIWVNREHIWKNGVPNDPIAMLDAAIAFEAIGYEFELADSLGQLMTSSGMIDVAGFIDKSKMYAGVSSQFPLTTRNFTAAHELGHAVLHDAVGLHRDRAFDGVSVSGPRERVEVEADKFATYFLMPEKVVRAEFAHRFSVERFQITDDTAFALINDTQESLRRKCTSLRHLSRIMADADHCAGKFFVTMADRFRVSNEAMAIRLEELHLLEL